MTVDWETALRQLIENDPRTTPEVKQRMLAMMDEVDAAVAATVETDPEVLAQVREFDAALDDIYARLHARQIDARTFLHELDALFDAAPHKVVMASNAQASAMIAALRMSGDGPSA